MTDFLTQLVARSSGSAETIRPRPASIFEPARLAAGPVAGPATAPEFFDDLPMAEDIPLEARLSAEWPGSPVAESVVGQLEHRSHGTRVEAGVLAAKASPPHFPPEGRESSPQGNLAPLPEPETPQSLPQAHVVQFSPAAQAAQPGSLFPSSPPAAAAPDGEMPGVSPHASGRAAHLQRERVATADRENSLGFRPLDESTLLSKPLPTPSTVLPRASVVRESRNARVRTTGTKGLTRQDAPEVRWAAESEPVIQVTIGRVEVRAASSPVPAAAKERSTPPVMSLDEYLRRRSPRGRE